MSRYLFLHPGRLAREMMAMVIFGLGCLTVPGPGATAAQALAQTDYCANAPLSKTPVLPTSFSGVLQAQVGANCIAWQQFIALNWKADPANPGYPDSSASWEDFGVAGASNPTVWMSYRSATDIFQNGANKTPANGEPVLQALSMQDDINLVSIGQAGDGKWLTSQWGSLTYYEVRLNSDEEAYILNANGTQTPLTTATGQQNCAKSSAGFQLPIGYGKDKDCAGNAMTFGSDQGAIEIKAAWLALPDDGSLNERYLTMQAQTQDPVTGELSSHTMGLVGLHIIRRLPGANQFLWSTFEQIDNDPDYSNGKPTAPTLPANPNIQKLNTYTYYNSACDPLTDPYKCVINQLPGTPCTSTGQNDCVPYTTPNQIARIYPVVTQSNNVTGQVWGMLPAKSVFNYYRLIDVQWPAQNAPIPPQSTVPLTTGNIQPPNTARVVSNTTMETYLQTKSCMDCHQAAPLASAQTLKASAVEDNQRDVAFPTATEIEQAAKTGQGTFAADYSFVFVNEASP